MGNKTNNFISDKINSFVGNKINNLVGGCFINLSPSPFGEAWRGLYSSITVQPEGMPLTPVVQSSISAALVKVP